MELAPYLCYQLDFLLDFFTEDKSYQYLQDASSLPCYLIRARSKLSPNIRNIGSSPFHTDFFPTGSDVTASFAYERTQRRKAKMADFVWRIGNFSNIPTLVSQRSYQISSQTTWHPLAPDKTFLQ